MIDTIAFDADDTLWQNEKFFRLSQDSFASLLRDHATEADLERRLLAAQKRNLSIYGFGIKGFVLSMIETAIDVSDDTLPPTVLRDIIAIGRDLTEHPLELLPGAREAVTELSSVYRTVLTTKGDLFDQERKIAQSGISDLFEHIEIVSDKTAKTYLDVFSRLGSSATRGCMVGNSLKSDVHPMLEAGGRAVYIAHPLTWEAEHAEVPLSNDRFFQAQHLFALPSLIDEVVRGGARET